jgi:phosphopantetheinyl transferase
VRRALASLTLRSCVDVWVVSVTDEEPLAGDARPGGRPVGELLATTEHRRSMVARAALARLVATRTGVDPAAVELGHDARGRPLLPGSALHVSIAHSGEYVACAVAERCIGVDIERSDRAEADEELARRVCSPAERERLGPLTAAELIRLWARKEAVAKLLGLGLALNFDQLDVSRDVPRVGGVRARRLRVRDLAGGPSGYALALATEAGRWGVRARLVVHGTGSVRGERPSGGYPG